MILNTESVADIADIYLNSHFKYYLDVSKLASRIADRRPDLTGDIPKTLGNYRFVCAVDGNGNLVSPYIPQELVNVGRQYAGKCVSCKLLLNESGGISAEDLSVCDDNGILTPVLLCALKGYSLENMLPILKNLLGQYDRFQQSDVIQMTDDREARRYFTLHVGELLLEKVPGTSEYDEQLSCADQEKQRLKEMVKTYDLDIVDLKNAVVDWFERNCRIIPLYQMQKMTTEITDIYVRRSNDGEEAVRFLYELFFEYSNYFRSNDIVKLWYEQLKKYFDEDLAENFGISVKKSQRYSQNKGIERKSYNGRISNANA